MPAEQIYCHGKTAEAIPVYLVTLTPAGRLSRRGLERQGNPARPVYYVCSECDEIVPLIVSTPPLPLGEGTLRRASMEASPQTPGRIRSPLSASGGAFRSGPQSEDTRLTVGAGTDALEGGASLDVRHND